MKLTFVSHAGYIYESNGVSIFTDPWTKGKAFNDSWALHTKAIEVDYSKIKYIFVSHEHPDHFSFPTLKGIPENLRSEISILYQEHSSKRLLEAFKKLNFKKVIELPIYKWYGLSKEVELYCGSAGSMDSFLVIRENGKSILNLNDCAFTDKQYKYIHRQIGDVDILFTQFSFANWVGNDGDINAEAKGKIETIKLQMQIFHPKFVIPFASFVAFCNKENCRQNAWANTPEYIQQLGIPNLNFMYPGDSIDIDDPKFNSPLAVQKYMEDMKNVKIDPVPASVSFEDILTAAKENIDIFCKKIPKLFRRSISPFSVFINDLDRSIFVDPANGVVKEINDKKCRFSMCSQVCWYTFKYSWGTGTLMVSAMYLDNEPREKYSRYFFFQNMLSTEYVSFSNPEKGISTVKFFWRKKWEVLYRFV